MLFFFNNPLEQTEKLQNFAISCFYAYTFELNSTQKINYKSQRYNKYSISSETEINGDLLKMRPLNEVSESNST